MAAIDAQASHSDGRSYTSQKGHFINLDPPRVSAVIVPGQAMSTIIGTGASVTITAQMLTPSGGNLTGAAVALKVRRASDGKMLDFASNTFRASGWTTIAQTMAENDATNDPGAYSYTWNTGGITNANANDTYAWRADATSGASAPFRGEIQVSTVVDRVDQATTAAVTAVNAHTDTDVAPLATSSGVTAATSTITSAITSAVSTIDAHTDSATSPLATSSALTTATSTIDAHTDAAVAPLATSAALTTAVSTIDAHTDSALATAVSTIDAHTDSATGSLATSSALATAQSDLTTIKGTGFVSGTDDLHALHALTNTLATNGNVSAYGTSILAAIAGLPNLSSIPPAVWGASLSAYSDRTTGGGALVFIRKLATNRLEETPGSPGVLTLYQDDATTPFVTYALRDYLGSGVGALAGQPARRAAAI